MTTPTKADIYLRFVTERHAELRQRVSDLLSTLATNDSDAKEREVSSALEAAKKLAAGLPADDLPGWLNTVINRLSRPRDFYSYQQLLLDVIPLLGPLSSHQWHAESLDALAFDFDSVFEHYKSQSKIPDLFDQVIDVLERISATEDIDSRKVIHALERLIATLRRNKAGSYFSMQGAWEFLVGLLKNFLIEELKKVPALGSLISALEKTVSELNTEMQTVKGQMAKELHNSLNSDFPFLTYDRDRSNVLATTGRLVDITA